MRLGFSALRLLGVGSGIVSADGVPIGTGGAVSTFSAEEFIYQNTTGQLSVNACRYDDLSVRVLEEHGAGELRGGGGLYTAFLASIGSDRGIRTNTGYRNVNERGLDVAPDGSAFWTTVFQDGRNATLRSANGTPHGQLMTGAFYGNSQGLAFRALTGDRAVWVEDKDKRTHAFGLPGFIAPTWDVFWVTPAELPFGSTPVVYLCELGGSRLTLRRADSLNGYIVATGVTQAPDSLWTAGTDIVVGWATTTGEGPADGRSVAVDVSAPVEPQPPTRTFVSFPAVGGKCWTSAFYSFSEKHGDTDDPIGNCQTIVDDESDPWEGPHNRGAMGRTLDRMVTKGLPLIIGATPKCDTPIFSPAILDLTVAWWTSGHDSDSLGNGVDVLKGRPSKMIIAYMDTGDPKAWPAQRPAWMTDQCVPQFQAYPWPTEDIFDFAERCEHFAQRLLSYRTPGFGICARLDADFYEQFIDSYAMQMWTTQPVVFHVFSDRRGEGLGSGRRDQAKALFYSVPERPARYTGWTDPTLGEIEVLKRTLAQNVKLMQLTEKQRLRLLSLL